MTDNASEPVIKVTHYSEGDEIETCLLCGHDDHPDNGGYDYTHGDWYCETCLDTAPSGEVPTHVF